MMSERYDNISKIVVRLCDDNISTSNDIPNFVKQLHLSALKSGLSSKDLEKLINLIANPYSHISQSSKFSLLKSLIPRTSITNSTVIKICSSIGLENINISDKRISKNLQSLLLRWLVSSLHILEDPSILDKLYSVFFNHISFEFSRAHISNLLFMITKKKHVKPWRVEFLRNLHERFPSDDHVAALLVFFKQQYPEFIKDDFGSVNPKIFDYPDLNYLDKVNGMYPQNQITKRRSEFDDQLQRYRDFGITLKKRKMNKRLTVFEDLSAVTSQSLDSQLISINDIQTKFNLISCLDRIRFVNICSIFKNAFTWRSNFKILYLLLQERSVTLDYIDKLDYWVRLSLLDENIDEKGCESILHNAYYFTMLSQTLGTVLKEFASFSFSPVKGCSIQKRLKFFTFLPIIPWVEFEPIFYSYLEQTSSNEQDATSFVGSLFHLINRWIKISQERRDVFEVVNKLIPKLTLYFLKCFEQFTHKFKLHSLLLFDFFVGLDSDITRIDLKNLILPPPYMYHFILSKDPLLVSEVARYIAIIKKYKVTDNTYDNLPESTKNEFKNLLNSYVMDFCNLIWRDKAFTYSSNSSNKAFLIPDLYISQLSKMNDRSISFDSLFNIFNNAAFSYSSINIVREIEDADHNVSVRHAGPITKASVASLMENPEWLSLEYDELQIQVLKRLDNLGYTGIADLLFSSLKSLVNRR